MTSLFTQSYRDSGFEGLVPMGIVYAIKSYCEGKSGGIFEWIRQEFEKQHVEFVFNCKFTFTRCGHPDNDIYTCEVIGDAYKLSSSLQEALISEQRSDVERVSERKTKWELRCGLVTIAE